MVRILNPPGGVGAVPTVNTRTFFLQDCAKEAPLQLLQDLGLFPHGGNDPAHEPCCSPGCFSFLKNFYLKGKERQTHTHKQRKRER